MKHYLGIDPGTACGWAILFADGRRVASGVWDLNAQRHEGGGMRFLRLRKYLDETLSATGDQITAVGYEEVARHAGTAAAHVYGGIVATVQAWCEEHSLPYSGQPVGTVKKLATGKGNANKAAMEAAAFERWRYMPSREDEADALWIAETLRRSLIGEQSGARIEVRG